MGLFGGFKNHNSSKGVVDNEVIINDDYDDEDSDENISVYDAADIWASNGKDEDYMFGYTEEELEDAL